MKNFYRRENHKFSSGCYAGQDFLDFAGTYKAFLKGVAKNLNANLIMGKPGHYYLSRFIEKDGRFIYGSTPDVRYSKGRLNNILIRTAKHAKDFSGGVNNSSNVENLQRDMNNLLQ